MIGHYDEGPEHGDALGQDRQLRGRRATATPTASRSATSTTWRPATRWWSRRPDDYYTYEITSSLRSTPPTNTSVLKPVPAGSGFTEPGRYLTLTTCTPEFTSTNRLIVWGKLIEERPRSKGKPDALVGG